MKLFVKVSWKPRNWKNKSAHQIEWNFIIHQLMVFSLHFCWKLFQFYSQNKYTATFGFCKDWAVEKCTEPVFKMFWKPRNEQNKCGYFFWNTLYMCMWNAAHIFLIILDSITTGDSWHVTPLSVTSHLSPFWRLSSLLRPSICLFLYCIWYIVYIYIISFSIYHIVFHIYISYLVLHIII